MNNERFNSLRSQHINTPENMTDAFKALEAIVKIKSRDKFYNITIPELDRIVKDNPDKFPGVADGTALLKKLAPNIRELRAKLKLPENIARGY
ncbi:MAG: hypothetical protein V4486_02290 [Patescibacteria group bacterium]